MSDLTGARLARLQALLADDPAAALVVAAPANVAYATGYRSVAGSLFRAHQMAAVVTPDSVHLACPAADVAPAVDAGVDPESIEAFGRFYFESASGHRAADMADRHPDLAAALLAVLDRLDLGAAPLAVDLAGLAGHRPAVEQALVGHTLHDAGPRLFAARARKFPDEVDLLRRAARLAETGIDRALASATVGTTERELARIVAGTMVEGDAMPAFVVVTSGERSALADAVATDRPIGRGDLVRFDVGCILDGYFSDMARTAVVGPATALQTSRYNALLAGEQAQLDAVRPGVTASELFDIAVEVVQSGGITPYRRHHCGHGIGSDVYEPPIVAPGHDVPLEADMTFCLETPYYELGWGGMMVEDTILVTADGHERFTRSDRSLREVPA